MARKKKKTTRLQRYRRRIEKALEGTHSKEIILSESLTGCAADLWTTLREASAGLAFGDLDFIVLLLMRAGSKVRTELREMDREPN